MTKSQSFILTFLVLLLLLSLILLAPSTVLGQKSKSRRSKPAPGPTELIAEVEPQSIAENWKTFTSAEGRFSITTPGTFLESLRTAQSSDGAVPMYLFTYFANAEYSVSYADYLSVIEGNDRMKLFLDGVRDSGVKGINGRLLEEQEITVDGHPGRAYRIEYGKNRNQLLVGRNVVVGQRLYIVATTYAKRASPTGGSYAEWSQRFLDSFKLTDSSA